MNDIVERLRHKHALYQTPAILDEAADEIERLQAEVSDLRFQARNLIVSVDKLAAERDALKKDAERYRWLRTKSAEKHDFYDEEERWMVSRAQGGMGQNFFGEKIDAAIDEAMKEGT